MRQKYRKPPVNEVVIGVYFSPILALRAEHVGIFWTKVEESFPRVSQNVPVGDIDIAVEGEVFPLPRFWFIAQDDVYLVQLQRNAFIFNWRKRESAYPHYEEVKAAFDRHFNVFKAFCEQTFRIPKLEIVRCELNYVNLIEGLPADFGLVRDTDKMIPSYKPLVIEPGNPPRAFALTYEYAIASDLTLTVIMQSRKNQKTGKDILYLELRTMGALQAQTASARDGWFERAHDTIGSAFNALTSKSMQEEHWQVMKEDGQ